MKEPQSIYITRYFYCLASVDFIINNGAYYNGYVEAVVNAVCGSKNSKSEPQKSFLLLNEPQRKLKQYCKKQVKPTIALIVSKKEYFSFQESGLIKG